MRKRDEEYFELGEAFGQRPRESLGMAARRVVNTRGRQIMAAQALLSSDETGDAAWARIARALTAAKACKW